MVSHQCGKIFLSSFLDVLVTIPTEDSIMKLFVSVLALLGMVGWSMQADQCVVAPGEPIKEWSDMAVDCHQKLNEHIKMELNASLTYLAMAAQFTSHQLYRPGVAAFFLAGASEERQHAKELMEYMLLRGKDLVPSSIMPEAIKPKLSWTSVHEALMDALDTEKEVRRSFVEIIKLCESSEAKETEGFNDYHVADLLTGTFLQEQHDSIRKIGGHLATLAKMKQKSPSETFPFYEIMFDQTLLQ